jgi:hypothetical protein
MIVYDFYSGTGSSTKAFEEAGHTVIKVELDEYFEANERDILSLTADYLVNKYGKPDFIWASPPCTAFSVAAMWRHWEKGGIPKSDTALMGIKLATHTIKLIQELQPTIGWLMENPRGMMRKMPFVEGLPRQTITYCQYGDFRMKPTDLWGHVPGWTARPMCKNGDSCHEASPRGSNSGTQRIRSPRLRSMIPADLGIEILASITQAVDK